MPKIFWLQIYKSPYIRCHLFSNWPKHLRRTGIIFVFASSYMPSTEHAYKKNISWINEWKRITENNVPLLCRYHFLIDSIVSKKVIVCALKNVAVYLERDDIHIWKWYIPIVRWLVLCFIKLKCSGRSRDQEVLDSEYAKVPMNSGDVTERWNKLILECIVCILFIWLSWQLEKAF